MGRLLCMEDSLTAFPLRRKGDKLDEVNRPGAGCGYDKWLPGHTIEQGTEKQTGFRYK